jgi:hypothetical protein
MMLLEAYSDIQAILNDNYSEIGQMVKAMLEQG